MRLLVYAMLAVFYAWGQTPARGPRYVITPTVGDQVGQIDFLERRANGTNKLTIKAEDSMAGDITWTPAQLGARKYVGFYTNAYDSNNAWAWETISVSGACPAGVVTVGMTMSFTNGGGGTKTPLQYTGRPCTSFGTSPLDALTVAGGVHPSIDNNWTSGTASQRWADVQTVLLNGVAPPTVATPPITLTSGNIACSTCAATNAANTFTADQNFQSIATYNVTPRANNTYINGGSGAEWAETWTNELLMRTAGTFGIWAGFPAGTPTFILGANDGAGNLTAGTPSWAFTNNSIAMTGVKGGVSQASFAMFWDLLHPTQAVPIVYVRDYAGVTQVGQYLTITVRDAAGTGTCNLTFAAGWFVARTGAC